MGDGTWEMMQHAARHMVLRIVTIPRVEDEDGDEDARRSYGLI